MDHSFSKQQRQHQQNKLKQTPVVDSMQEQNNQAFELNFIQERRNNQAQQKQHSQDNKQPYEQTNHNRKVGFQSIQQDASFSEFRPKTQQPSQSQEMLQYFERYVPQSQAIQIQELHQSKKIKLKRYKESMYYGEIVNNKRHGRGVMIYDSGRVYQGFWQADSKHGSGYEKFPNQTTYQGFYINGKPHGLGRFSWPNGEFYQGEWQNGFKHGSGMWKGAKGDSYVGDWKFGKADGYGVHNWINGDRYQGEFLDSVKHGEGIENFANGDIYKGKYLYGKPNGYGQYYWKNGSFYKGRFKDGFRQGHGIWKRGTGNSDRYQGQYLNDKKQGYGIFSWADGNVFKGTYKDDQRNGFGCMFWSDGSYYKGQWENGLQHGEGEIFTPGQGVKKGQFFKNQLVALQNQLKPIRPQTPIDISKYLHKQGYDKINTIADQKSEKKSNVSKKHKTLEMSSKVRHDFQNVSLKVRQNQRDIAEQSYIYNSKNEQLFNDDANQKNRIRNHRGSLNSKNQNSIIKANNIYYKQESKQNYFNKRNQFVYSSKGRLGNNRNTAHQNMNLGPLSHEKQPPRFQRTIDHNIKANKLYQLRDRILSKQKRTIQSGNPNKSNQRRVLHSSLYMHSLVSYEKPKAKVDSNNIYASVNNNLNTINWNGKQEGQLQNKRYQKQDIFMKRLNAFVKQKSFSFNQAQKIY